MSVLAFQFLLHFFCTFFLFLFFFGGGGGPGNAELHYRQFCIVLQITHFPLHDHYNVILNTAEPFRCLVIEILFIISNTLLYNTQKAGVSKLTTILSREISN